MKKNLFFCCLLLVIAVVSRGADYNRFHNVRFNTDAYQALCFERDEQGLMWIGTNKGLCSYDGFNVVSHYVEGSLQNNPVYCIISTGNGTLVLGTERGVQFYDIRKDSYTGFWEGPDCLVRTMVRDGDSYLVGTFRGLYRVRRGSNTPEQLPISKDIYSIARQGDTFYISTSGATGGLYALKEGTDDITRISLGGPSTFLFSLYPDQDGAGLWFCAGGLYRYDTLSGKLDCYTREFTAKDIIRDDDGHILLATDNGIKEVDTANGTVTGYGHNVFRKSSLASDTVHRFYRDGSGTLWVGTDSGISILHQHDSYQRYALADFKYPGEGNKFFVMEKDLDGNLWMGGNNGLVMNPLDGSRQLVWYNSSTGNPSLKISHNRVRDICCDSKGRLWVVTDRDLMLYDRNSRRFMNCAVHDPDTGERAYWFFDIQEDGDGNLWLSTFIQGIFKVDADALEKDHDCACSGRYTVSDGLCSNYISTLAYNGTSDMIFTLNTQLGVDCIDCVSGRVTHVELPEGVEGQPVSSMIGSGGVVRLAFSSGIAQIDAVTQNSSFLPFSEGDRSAVSCMAEIEGMMWVCTNDGIRIISREGQSMGTVNLDLGVFTAICDSPSDGSVYLGGDDAFVRVDRDIVVSPSPVDAISLSRVYVNGDPYFSDKGEDGRFLDNITLNSRQNNIRLEFADLSYDDSDKKSFMYSVNGSQMKALPPGTNGIDFPAMKAGRYDIAYCGRSILDSGPIKHLVLTIKRPVLLSVPAYILYALLFFGLAFYYFRMRSRMKYERFEKENALRQVNEKKSFVSDISHEFKTPLSMILGPAGKMLMENRSDEDRKNLELIKNSALKLDNLIHKAIEYDKVGTNPEEAVMRMNLDLVEFSESVMSVFREQDKGKDYIFVSTEKHLPYSADAVKLESILNNLISNASKYTSEGDSIILSVGRDEARGLVVLKLTDTGTGISADELPYIFQRFYQSPTNSAGKEGSGIGLNMARNYARLMGGDIVAESELGKGTSFSVFLPAEYICAGIKEGPVQGAADEEDKALVVIVEDNQAVADFLTDLLKDNYRCLVAQNGKSGLSLCMEVKPDLVITDIMMPVMDGYQMCTELRSNPSMSNIPLVVLTAVEDKKYELLSAECNIDAFITKPFDPAFLYAKVRSLIDRKRDLEKKIRMEMIAQPHEISAMSADEKLLEQIVKTIEDNISDSDFNVNSLCELLSISSKQLYRKCKQFLNMTPVEYIRHVRLKKAALLLEQHRFNVSEAMYMVGFNNQSYFSRCFLKEFGVTPQQYRKNR